MNIQSKDAQHSGHYINGQWQTSQGSPFYSVNPANGTIIWQGFEATNDEVMNAFDGAARALKGWRTLLTSKRAEYLQRFAQLVETKKDALARLISLETGKPLWESATEVQSVIGKINLSIRAYQDRCSTTRTEAAEADTVLRYKPQGVITVLGPFNFPAHLSNGHIVPALLAGNTIVYKPSELTPAVAAFVMQCWHDAGLPAGVIQCVQGGVSTAKALLDCPIQGVFFTGSYHTGALIHRHFAGRPEVILALEMGGNNPLIIDNVQDLDTAVYYTILSTLITAGQRCTCARRLFVPHSASGEKYIEKLITVCKNVKIGAFTQTPEPFMGPVIRYEHAMAHLKSQDALIKLGGQSLMTMSLLEANTGFLSPGIIEMTTVNHPPDEEIFAPLIQLYRYDDFEAAIQLANQTAYGLAAGLFSDNEQHYQHFYDHINAGLINWNRPTTGAASALPFGGIGKSGNHRPSAYFASDYCAYPISSLENSRLCPPSTVFPGLS
jgi:succinylglutamic semialdehyde dehydrogenase